MTAQLEVSTEKLTSGGSSVSGEGDAEVDLPSEFMAIP